MPLSIDHDIGNLMTVIQNYKIGVFAFSNPSFMMQAQKTCHFR